MGTGPLRRRTQAAHRAPPALTRELGQAEGRAQQLEDAQVAELGRRDEAVRAFQRFAVTGLLAAAKDLDVPETDTPWVPDPAVRLARRLEQALIDVEDGDEGVDADPFRSGSAVHLMGLQPASEGVRAGAVNVSSPTVHEHVVAEDGEVRLRHVAPCRV
jgi:hypothetical protein